MLDHLLSFRPHIDILTARLRKLIFIFKNLRHSLDTKLLRRVYLALGHSISTYFIAAWGGCSKTHLLMVERAQRAILKVGWHLPIRFPTTDLYQMCNVLTVRQSFILQIILKMHSSTPYDPSLLSGSRRRHKVSQSISTFTTLAQRHFLFLGPFLYNKVNKILNLYPMTKSECKSTVVKWLMTLDYNSTENMLTIQK